VSAALIANALHATAMAILMLKPKSAMNAHAALAIVVPTATVVLPRRSPFHMDALVAPPAVVPTAIVKEKSNYENIIGVMNVYSAFIFHRNSFY
jgi:hypothetical protein